MRSEENISMVFPATDEYDSCDAKQRYHVQSPFLGLVIILLSFISFAGNGLVILSFFTNSELRRQKGSYLICNLAISDFICSAYIMLPCAVSLINNAWRTSGFFCRVNTVLNYAVLNSSYMSLAAINVDRAIAIKNPFTYPNLITSSRIKAAITCIWIHGFFFGTLAATVRPTSFEYSELLCAENACIKNITFTLISTTACFGVSSLSLLISVLTVISFVKKSRKVYPMQPGTNRNLKNNTKMLKSLFILVGVYFIFDSPYFVFKTALALTKTNFIPTKLCLLPVLMLFSTTILNPLIYGILRKDQREYSMKSLRMVSEKINNSNAYQRIKQILFVITDEPKRFFTLLQM
ncbi:5-hydroxytryptamine receptor 7-like [Parasteatoda tepidariorum]|uniref:5-hydroxytryptamine receptor 7-like n=1 Tax=Parasteatoda tepidariorum TaxID=114398 RepID=UPI0039BCE8F5